jgi:hypothetical protein
VGGRGHRKGQLRVLGSPSALRTKKPRTGGPPESAGPIYILKRKPLEGTKTGLWAPSASASGKALAAVRLSIRLI